MEPCEFAETCPFFRTHRYDPPTVRRKILDLYCLGELRESCMCRTYRLERGEMPPADMLPTDAPAR